MPVPINKVKDQMVESQNLDFSFIPLLKMPTTFMLLNNIDNKNDKEAIKKVWLHSDEINGKMKVQSSVSKQDVSFLQSKGYIRSEGDFFEFTKSGKDLLKKAILEDEKSSLTKTASKKMIAKNSYDFGEEVLVKINHPEKFGTRYIAISKKAFNKKGLVARSPEIDFSTVNSSGIKKDLKDYTDNELISILALAKKTIKNASKISLEKQVNVPVNRLKAFSEMIMEELNDPDRKNLKSDTND